MRKRFWIGLTLLFGVVILVAVFVLDKEQFRYSSRCPAIVREAVLSESKTGTIHKSGIGADCPCVQGPQLMERLRKTYEDIAVAFSNREVVVMQQLFSQVREHVRMLKLKDFNSASSAIERAYWDTWFIGSGEGYSFRPLENFSTAGEFSLYVESILALVKIRGDGFVIREDWDGYKGIEALPLRLLKEYRKKFSEEGRRELEVCADRAISQWIAFIESEEGYSRRYAREVLPDNLKIHENGSREDAVKITRLAASAELETFAGYIPKWLEEIK